ncbi:plasmid partitioning protein RepA, partial [Rhizobium brockwellii]
AAIVEKAKRATRVSIDETIAQDSTMLSSQLQVLFERLFSPDARKSLRRFSSTETAKLLGVTDSYVRHLAAQVESINP